MVTIIDYGMGNIRSVQNALEWLGLAHQLSSDPAMIERGEKLLLPGVGSFREAMENIHHRGLAEPIKVAVAKGTPLLGICLGMQLLADTGTEDGSSEGLGLISGDVIRLDNTRLPIPHVGFNAAKTKKESRLFASQHSADYYFVHSYHLCCNDPADIAATTNYGQEFVSAVERGNIFGAQFHPEKSQSNGLNLLRNFGDL